MKPKMYFDQDIDEIEDFDIFNLFDVEMFYCEVEDINSDILEIDERYQHEIEYDVLINYYHNGDLIVISN